MDRSARAHEDCVRILKEAEGPLVMSPFVLAELDYLIATRIGRAAADALLREVADRVYELADVSSQDVGEAVAALGNFGDLGIGLADASLVVLSHRLNVRDVLTLDERHFRVLRSTGDRPFRLLPADA